MTDKPLRIAPWVVAGDLQRIYDYHWDYSPAKADRIVEEYDQIIGLLAVNPRMLHERANRWRVYPFRSGPYLLYYREMTEYWIVAAMLHAFRSPAAIDEELRARGLR